MQVGKPVDLGSDPLDELHSLSHPEPVGRTPTHHAFVAPRRGSVVQHTCPGAGARVRRGAAKTGWNPALSRNREAPFGDESGRLLRGANDGPRRKGGLWAARSRPIAAPSDRKEGGWANLSASSWRSGSRCRSRRAAPTKHRNAATGSDGASPTSGTSSFPVTVEGTNGEVTIDDRPVRIVSLSPTATEDLFAIGAGEQVIAVDDQSNFPPEAPMTELSGFEPNVEAIAGYEPDLVVFATEPGDLGSSLEGLGITALQLDAAATLDVAYEQIEQLGLATGHAVEAEALVDDMRSQVDAARRRRRSRGGADLLLRARRHLLLGHVEDVHRAAVRAARAREHRRRGRQGQRRVPAALRRVHHRVRSGPDLPRRHEVLRPVARDRRRAGRAGTRSRPSATAASCRSTTTSRRAGARGSSTSCSEIATAADAAEAEAA